MWKDSSVNKQQFRKKGGPKKTVTNPTNAAMLGRFKCYKAFLDNINSSNNVSITSERLEVGRKYIAHFGKGNNSNLIKNIIKSRPWWALTEDPDDPRINFVWTQLRQNDVLDKCKSIKNDELDDLTYQLMNPLKESKEGEPQSEDEDFTRSTQMNYRTFGRSHSVNKESPNYTSRISCNTVKTIKRNNSKPREIGTSKILPNSGKDLKDMVEQEKERTDNKRDLINPKVLINYQNLRRIFSQKDLKNLKAIGAILDEGGIRTVTRNKIKQYEGCTTFLLHNHLENNWHLSNKKALFLNVKTYYEVKKINPFEYIPVTFHVESLESKEFKQFLEYYNSKTELETEGKKQYKNKTKKRNVWLVKPGENTNRGTGIMVSESLEEIQ